MNTGKSDSPPDKTFTVPDFIQLFMLVIQTIYLLLFFSDISGFRNVVILRYFEAAFILLAATSLVSFIAYWFGFFRKRRRGRILFALLLLFHLGIAYSSFALTVLTAISRS
jgi:hypothetical protein